MPALTTKRRVPILMYHSISRRATDRFKRFTVSPSLFAEQVAHMRRNGYTSLTVTQYVHACTQGEMLPERPVILTFDDGFADFYDEAFQVLERHRFVATLYVTSGFVNGTSRWLQREGEAARAMLTWDQLKEVVAYGVECGAHSHSHPQLDTLSPQAAKMEIIQSKLLLEDRLGQQVWSFAYPYGYYIARVKQQVKEAGYTSACAVKYSLSDVTGDPFALARQMVAADTDIDALEVLLTKDSPSITRSVYKYLGVPLWRCARLGSASLTRLLPDQEQVAR
jgi:peptidoglycan/xylan/chitin deacetylase (PgdA/CDA1 family)